VVCPSVRSQRFHAINPEGGRLSTDLAGEIDRVQEAIGMGTAMGCNKSCRRYNEIRGNGVSKEYIEERSGGKYIAGTRVSLASVVAQFQQGASPETILQNFPALASLENVYGAIVHYLANQSAVDQYLRAEELKWEHFRNTADPPPALAERVEGYGAKPQPDIR